jgi:uracil-DNA glycosylase
VTDERADLLSLVRATRAYLEQHRDAGTLGFSGDLPPDVPAPAPARPAKEPSRPIAHRIDEDAPRPSRPEPPATERSVVAPTAFTPLAEGERASRLQVLSQTVAGCTKCILHEGRTQTVFARGNPSAELCFIGEGPGADEDAQGLPFVGKAGQLLDRMIVAMGYAPDEVYVCNIVKCRPPANRKPEPDEMRACMPYLTEQLGILQPKVIVALGGTAAEGLLGAPVSITRIRGQWKLYRASIPMMPTFHPAYLLRTPEAKRDVWADLQAVLERLGKKAPKRGT